MRKSDKNDWFKAGLRILGEDGFARLTIEALCGRLGLTKGSFYHHFGNMDGYVAALMQHWLEEATLSFIRRAEAQKAAGGRREVLARLASGLGQSGEQAIRAWGQANGVVAMYLRQADAMRLKYLETIMLEDGLDGAAALRAARLEYALMVGLRQLYPGMSRDELRAVYESRA